MIVIDSSVWMAQLRGTDIATIARLHNIKDPDRFSSVTLFFSTFYKERVPNRKRC